MGKRKQGSALRAKRRADVTAEELADAMAVESEQARTEAKGDDTLFVLDTARDQSAVTRNVAKKDRLSKEEKAAKRENKYGCSEKDKRQIKKMVNLHGEEGVEKIAVATRTATIRKKRTGGALKSGGDATKFDLWGSDNGSSKKAGKKSKAAVLVPATNGVASMCGVAPVVFVEKTSSVGEVVPSAENKWLRTKRHAAAKARPTVAVDIAHEGQSYRPDKEKHQDAIGEALSIEVRRNEAIEEKKAPIGGGCLSEETLAIMIKDGESESESDDDDDEDLGPTGLKSVGVAVKRDGKLTRAQRNRQKRVRSMNYEVEERKRTKALGRQINHMPTLSKQARKADMTNALRNAEIRTLKAEALAVPLGTNLWMNLSEKDPTNVPSLPVALTEELDPKKGKGFLRTMKPKGSLLTDRMESMAARKMIHKRKPERRHVVEGKRRKLKSGKGREYLLV